MDLEIWALDTQHLELGTQHMAHGTWHMAHEALCINILSTAFGSKATMSASQLMESNYSGRQPVANLLANKNVLRQSANPDIDIPQLSFIHVPSLGISEVWHICT